MWIPSRKMFAGIMSLAMVCGLGCGSKPEPDQPNVAITPITPSSTQNTTNKPEPTYELEPAKHVIPSGPVGGMLLGEKVTADVNIEGPLVIRKPAGAAGPDWQIQIELPPEAKMGEPFRLVTNGDQTNGPAITINYPRPLVLPKYEFEPDPNSGGAIKRKVIGWQSPTPGLGVMTGYSLTLELGKRAGGKVPGKLYLALPELETQSHPALRDFLAGTFEAVSVRQPSDPPGPEDVPYITGAITVRGSKADDALIVGYLASPTPEIFAYATTDLPLKEETGVARSARVDYDKPRVTLLSMGANADVPSRYEHSRLTPGRYLVFAGLKGGVTVGKWVTVTSTGTHTLDLTVDATQTGGLEVSFPIEILGKAHVAPASDDANQDATDQALFTAIALQFGAEQEITARKAVFKGLIPGKYEVRAGGHSRVIDVIAGKIMELDFDKKPEPKKTEPEPKTAVVPKP